MNHWIKKASENLLKYSVNNSDFFSAKEEWNITGRVVDNEIAEDDNICELCEHENLRWQFEIVNSIHKKILYVGSSCIRQFDIGYRKGNSNNLKGDERNKELNSMVRNIIEEKNYQELLKILRNLWLEDKKNRREIERIAKDWKYEKIFKPLEAAFILRRLKELKIDLNPKLLKISLRSYDDKDQIRRMIHSGNNIIFECLTTNQLKNVNKMQDEISKDGI
ncbi:MAG: hypothetical protein AB7V07_03215 [Candidatus Delongbacteria bacterium]